MAESSHHKQFASQEEHKGLARSASFSQYVFGHPFTPTHVSVVGSKYVVIVSRCLHFVQSVALESHHKQFALQEEHKGLARSAPFSQYVFGHPFVPTQVSVVGSKYVSIVSRCLHFVQSVALESHSKQFASQGEHILPVGLAQVPAGHSERHLHPAKVSAAHSATLAALPSGRAR